MTDMAAIDRAEKEISDRHKAELERLRGQMERECILAMAEAGSDDDAIVAVLCVPGGTLGEHQVRTGLEYLRVYFQKIGFIPPARRLEAPAHRHGAKKP